MSTFDDEPVGHVARLPQPSIEELMDFGYAEGDYLLGACRDCGAEVWMVAKRSYRCLTCATEQWKIAKEKQPECRVDPHTEQAARAIATKLGLNFNENREKFLEAVESALNTIHHALSSFENTTAFYKKYFRHSK